MRIGTHNCRHLKGNRHFDGHQYDKQWFKLHEKEDGAVKVAAAQ
jgi:hypothetical protein